MHKDRFPAGNEDEVWFAGKILSMESIPITHRMD